jgi:hypothetical protein
MKGNNSAQITNLNSSETDDPNIIFSSILFRAHFSLSSTLTLPLTLTRVLERELFGAHVGNTFRVSYIVLLVQSGPGPKQLVLKHLQMTDLPP